MSSPRLLHNIASLGVLYALNFGLGLIIIPHLARVLGVEGWGKIVFAQMIINYLIWFSNWSFYLGSTKKIASNRESLSDLQSIYSATLSAQWTLTVIAVLILVLSATIIPSLHTAMSLLLIGAGLLIANALQPFWFLNGMEKVHEAAAIQVFTKLLGLPAIFFLIKERQDGYLYFLITSVSAMLTGAATLYWIKRKYLITFSFKGYLTIRHELKEGLGLFISTIWANIYGSLIPMAVGIIAGPLQLGYYSLADRVRTAGMQLLHPVTHALFPRMCNLYAENREEAVKLLLKSGLMILTASLVISVATFFFSPLIIHFLGGSEFEPSIHILKIISFTVVITITFEFLMYQWLVVTHMDRLLNYSRVIPLVVALVLMYTMISSDGARGAAWLSVLCESLSTIIVIFGLRKGFRYRNE